MNAIPSRRLLTAVALLSLVSCKQRSDGQSSTKTLAPRAGVIGVTATTLSSAFPKSLEAILDRAGMRTSTSTWEASKARCSQTPLDDGSVAEACVVGKKSFTGELPTSGTILSPELALVTGDDAIELMQLLAGPFAVSPTMSGVASTYTAGAIRCRVAGGETTCSVTASGTVTQSTTFPKQLIAVLDPAFRVDPNTWETAQIRCTQTRLDNGTIVDACVGARAGFAGDVPTDGTIPTGDFTLITGNDATTLVQLLGGPSGLPLQTVGNQSAVKSSQIRCVTLDGEHTCSVAP